jgi:hypothetical protein
MFYSCYVVSIPLHLFLSLGILDEVHLLCNPGYTIACAGNLTEEKSCVIMFEFHAGTWIPEVNWNDDVTTSH